MEIWLEPDLFLDAPTICRIVPWSPNEQRSSALTEAAPSPELSHPSSQLEPLQGSSREVARILQFPTEPRPS